MGRKCVLRCPGGDSLHRFPKKISDNERRQEWCTRLGVEDTHPREMYACSKHFSEKMGSGPGIRRDAVPDVNTKDDLEPMLYIEIPEIPVFPNICNSSLCTPPNKNSIQVQTEPHLSSNSPRKLKLKSEIESLKKELRNTTKELKKKDKFIEAKSSKIKELEEKNLSLKLKLQNTSTIGKKLKRNNDSYKIILYN